MAREASGRAGEDDGSGDSESGGPAGPNRRVAGADPGTGRAGREWAAEWDAGAEAAAAERWIRAIREECLDHLLILSQAHLRRVLTVSVTCSNAVRPHQGLE